MSNSNLIHVRTVEGLMQAAMTQIRTMEPVNGIQAGAVEDMSDAIDELQKQELLALRNVFE